MIRSRDRAFRAALAGAPMDATCAAFEAVMLVRVAASPTGPLPGSLGRPSSAAPRLDRQPLGLLAEFESASAARRLAAAVACIAPVAEISSHGLGGRHRYEIHQVTLPPTAETLVRSVLARAGRAGSLALCGESAGHGLTVRQHRHHMSLAVAAWRAALLAAGPGRGVDRVTVRVGDRDTTRVLVRAAARLRVPVRAALRPGGHLLSVTGAEHVEVLVAATTGATGAPVPVTRLAG